MRVAVAILCLALSLSAQAEDVRALSAEGLALIPPFQKQLMETVKAALQAGGPLKAVEACQLQAPQIASQHSRAPWQVGRTSLQVRNPANAADAWEQQVLRQFAQRAAAGEPLAGMQHSAVVAGELRVMQAIAVGEPCLACHGKALKPELAALLDQRYPQDQARGYELGALRGAFTLKRSME
ncbi:MAG: DUF3365 domain-containing protein [Pseudomonas sp.]|nr:DUF3365 domain-containing protein [Pseudomonas sp.]